MEIVELYLHYKQLLGLITYFNHLPGKANINNISNPKSKHLFWFYYSTMSSKKQALSEHTFVLFDNY